MSMSMLKTNMFEELCKTPSDINEHLPTLRDLAKECDSVTEMGVRYIVSTWALLEGLKDGAKLTAIDIRHPREYGGNLPAFQMACDKKHINFKFVHGDTLMLTIEKTDLLFIDTLHENAQLLKELGLHAENVNKYIVLHDTTSCRSELWPVVQWFVGQGKWKIKKEYTNNNGLTILERC